MFGKKSKLKKKTKQLDYYLNSKGNTVTNNSYTILHF